MSHYCSPLRYPGGKGGLFSFVKDLFYNNELIGASYAEPYAGGAGLALRLLFEEYVKEIYINDLDVSIHAFWKTIVEQPQLFCNWIEDVDVTIKSWDYYRDVHRHADTSDKLELAKATFFLNRTNISGILMGGVIGGHGQNGKYKIDARFNKLDLIERIQKIARFSHRIHVSNLDGLTFIKKMDTKKHEVFIYLDPPYFLKGAELYMNYFSKKDHRKLSNYLDRIEKKWIVSYDNQDFILNLYAEKKRIVYKLAQSASNRVGDEVLIFSNQVQFHNSMEQLNHAVLVQ